MKRLLITGAAVAVVLLGAAALAACGGAGGTTTTSSNAAPGAGGATVATKQVAGTGNVLVDASGLPLYTNDQETGGTMLCNAACMSFWRPLTVTGTPSGGALADQVGVVTRTDGVKQVTFDGKLLYTFSLDKPGRVTGDGFGDAFDGQQFTWHVVHADGSTSSGSGQTTAPASRGY